MSVRVVKGVINVPAILSGELANIIDRELIERWIDSINHLSKGRFLLELVDEDHVSAGRPTTYAYYDRFDEESKMFTYPFDFKVPMGFGKIGAVLIKNEHHREKYVKNIVLHLDDGNLIFTCESWIHSEKDNLDKRIFFTNKSYLPSETPAGLMSLREEDLESLRGNGEGQRQSFERIYDYDTYNDLGDPDTSPDLARQVLGGQQHPYPRRCRTGRPMTLTDPSSESRTRSSFYVPRDEAFSDTKVVTSWTTAILCKIVRGLVPSLHLSSTEEILSFTDIQSWYDETVEIYHFESTVVSSVVLRLIKDLWSSLTSVTNLETSQTMDDISFCWYRDEEFCRQTLAGLNPYSIQLVTEWPLMSKLDPKVYGPAESAITKQTVEQEIKGFMTFEEALEQKKLFLLDYHDLLLPYVNKVRELEGTTLYGSRTLMFLSDGILRPVAIELTWPQNNGAHQWKRVYTPCSEPDAIETWLWKLAKAHVLAHDSGYHQLVSHWLRTHCVMEPYIIATHRCLSKMHPIHRLLSPHLRYTMQINSLARLVLINAGGIIESTFSLGKYSMEFSSHVYAQQWRFDHEALPADLISRGMAIEDPSAPHGVKLAIEDYPFANDGLILWDAIKQWATAYVNHYYPQANLVESDVELQAWWDDIKTKGHPDKKEGWPELKTRQDLIGIVTTIMWVASGHHSAVNFGQYTAGYYPHRPTIARTKMPDKDTPEDWEAFLDDPEEALRNCFPSNDQTDTVMSTLDVLSSHSPDEEYIGDKIEPAWEAEPPIRAAFLMFKGRLDDLGKDIDSKNNNLNLKNRKGSGSVPYELLKPKSEAGVTGKGIPYSISI